MIMTPATSNALARLRDPLNSSSGNNFRKKSDGSMKDIVVLPVLPMMPRTSSSWCTFIAMRNVRRSRNVVRAMCLVLLSGMLRRCVSEALHGRICKG